MASKFTTHQMFIVEILESVGKHKKEGGKSQQSYHQVKNLCYCVSK